MATSNGFIIHIDPTDQRKVGVLAPGLVETIAERCGRVPQRLLADTTVMSQEDIVKTGAALPRNRGMSRFLVRDRGNIGAVCLLQSAGAQPVSGP